MIFENFDYSQDSDSKGVLKAHVTQSIGMAYMDDRYNLLDYQSYISDNILYEFADILTQGIDRYMELVNSKKCQTHF